MSDQTPDSASYYDEFNAESAKSPINERIIGLYKRILKTGFNPDSINLEIGCGPGKLTWLLSRKLKGGLIEATDISPRSIEIASSKIKQSNVTFTTSDALEYIAKNAPFNNILLFDVLEHIPKNLHPALFQKIEKWMKDDSSLLINIPNPSYILFAQKHRSESLQEIDQPLFLNELSKAIYEANLEIRFMETYNIWAEDDYLFMVVRKQKPLTEKLIANQRNIFQKITNRIAREYYKMKYRY